MILTLRWHQTWLAGASPQIYHTSNVGSNVHVLPSGEHTKNYGTFPFSMGKSTISKAIFNSKLLVFVSHYQRVTIINHR